MSGISTHILDTSTGRPAAGVIVRLYSGDLLLSTNITNTDGRIAALLPKDTPLETGRYCLRFEIAAYLPHSFFPEVVIVFAITDVAQHYHVPLLLSPFGYSTYRAVNQLAKLTFDNYGKTRVRLTQVIRNGGRHEVVELSVKILFRGKFTESYTAADNSMVLPTDTIKNTVYVVARRNQITSIEQYARDLANHFLSSVPHLDRVKIEIQQSPWNRIENHGSAFVAGGSERRVVMLSAARGDEVLESGVHGLEILKTANSAFSDYLVDELTTLRPSRDRLFGTVMDADWTYHDGPIDYNLESETIRAALLNAFANHVSESVQHTLFDMAKAALEGAKTLKQIHLVMPNKHRLLVDLSNFKLSNPNQIFVPTDEPSGYIEARVTAD